MKKSTDVLVTALAPMMWGTTYLVTTELLPAGQPLFVGAMRALPIGLLLLLVFRQFPKGDWWLRSLLLGGLNIGLFFALLFVAAYRLPGGIAATVGAIQPLLVALLARWLLAETLSLSTFIASGIGIVGVAMIVLSPSAQLDGIGVMAALGAAASMALGTILTKKWGRPAPLLVFTAWQLTAGGLILLLLTLLLEGRFPALALTNALGFVYMGLMSTGLAYTLWFRGIERLPATTVTFLALFSPMVAVILGFLILNQSLAPIQIAGVVLTLIGVFIGQRAGMQVRPSPWLKLPRPFTARG